MSGEDDVVNNTEKQQELRSRTVQGVGWTAISRLVTQTGSIVIMALLARLLSPDDFGLLAMVTVFVGFATQFQEFGISSALIQRSAVTEEHYDSAFWMNLAIGVGLTILFIIMAPFLSRFYGEPQLKSMTIAISLTFTIGATTTVNVAIISRNMAYRLFGLIDMISVVGSGIVGVVCALLGFGVWSLVIRQLALTSLRTISLLYATRWYPHLRFSRQAIQDLLGYGSNLLGFRTVDYWTRSADKMLIGRTMAASELGYYSRAQSTILIVQNFVYEIFGRVMFPTLSRIQDDKAKVKRTFLRTGSIIMLLISPMMAGLFVVSEDFVLVLYGPQWTPTAPVLRIFSIIGILHVVVLSTGWLYRSQGRTDLQFRWGIVVSIATLIAFGFGVYIGSIEAVAWFYLLATAFAVAISLAVSGRLIGMSFGDYIRAVAPILMSSIAMAVAVWLFDIMLPAGFRSWQYLILDTLVGLIVFWVIIRFARIRAFVDAASIVSRQWPVVRRIPLASYVFPIDAIDR